MTSWTGSGVAEERCEISDLPREMCGHCHPERSEPGTPNPAGYGPWVAAKFDGECSGPCGGLIEAGDQIRSDGEGGWLCEVCGGG